MDLSLHCFSWLALGTLMSACTVHQIVHAPESDLLVPKHPSWSYGDKGFKNPVCVPDPDSLYVYHYSRDQGDGRWVDGYYFIRFWSNGRFLMRNFLIEDRKPNAEDGDEFLKVGTTVGHYTIKGEAIYLETFNFLGIYDEDKGVIAPQGLAIERDHGFVEKYERVRFPRGAMKRQPDW